MGQSSMSDMKRKANLRHQIKARKKCGKQTQLSLEKRKKTKKMLRAM